MDQNNQAWRVKTVRGDTFTVRTVLAIKPVARDGRWVAQVIVPEVTSYGASPRESVLRLALRLGWEVSEIAAPGERLASECSEAVRAALQLCLASLIVDMRADRALLLLTKMTRDLGGKRVSQKEAKVAVDAIRASEETWANQDAADSALRDAFSGPLGDALINDTFGESVMALRSLLEDES